ncbi:MAG: aspartate-ammonia lyase [Desulfatibacillaceae bacterium]|nr:aspartate-ammonia lyase [Desulfatibacillaceae bacterium]
MPSTTNNNLVGTAGEYYVCAELCRQNILALITPKNNPLFDILASDTEGKRSIAIQVKTMSLKNDQGWKLSSKMTVKKNNPNLFVVLVNMKDSGGNDYYIYQHDELAKKLEIIYNNYINTPKKDGSTKKEVGFRWFDFKYFEPEDHARLNKWSLLGF